MEGIMANKQFSNKVKREIEYTITTYLERRLRISCDLLKNNLKDKAVSLDEFVSELQETNRILDNLRRDITRSREKFLYEESINLRRINLVEQISHQVIPSDDNINEMLTLVKYYLNNYSLPNDESFNESFEVVPELKLPFNGSGTETLSETWLLTSPARYLRIAVTETNSDFRKFWHAAEFLSP